MRRRSTMLSSSEYNLGNDLVEKIIRGMVAAVSADEFDLADVKPGRNVFGKCRFQHVCTDGACGEYLIQVDGDEHVQVLTLCQMTPQAA